MTRRGRKASAPSASLNDLAYDRIKQDILRCVHRPGSNVSEAKLALRHRLGKAPVRAALLRLRQEGWVRSVPRIGHVIAPVTVRDVQELFEFRLLLEPGTARLAAGRIQPEELRQLRELCRVDKLTGTAFNRANTDFHVAIASAAGNRRLAATLSQLLGEMDRLVHLKLAPGDQSRALQEHRRLMRALADGDADAAERIAVEHIENARRNVMEAILACEQLRDAPIGGVRPDS